MILRFIVAIGVLLLAFVPAEARRVALVIGNSNYAEVGELNNPHADATAMAKAFQDAAFDDVKLAENLDFEHMRKELKEFSNRAAGAEIAVIYYAGHGVEMPDQNYLIPVDAKLLRSTDIEFEAITLASVRSAVSGASKLRMVILDACRNNLFKLAASDGKRRAATRGLAAVEPGAGEFIAYSAKEGSLAQDGPKDSNSPFATALLANLKRPGVEVRQMFGQIRDDVLEATGREQEPYTYNSLGGEAIYLKQPEAKPVLVIALPDTTAADFDLAQSLNSKAGWDLFLARHGTQNDMRVDLANLERDKLVLLVVPKLASQIVARSPDPLCVGVMTIVRGEKECMRFGERFTYCDDCPEMVVVQTFNESGQPHNFIKESKKASDGKKLIAASIIPEGKFVFPIEGQIVKWTLFFQFTTACENDNFAKLISPTGLSVIVMNRGLKRCSGKRETFESLNNDASAFLFTEAKGEWRFEMVDLDKNQYFGSLDKVWMNLSVKKNGTIQTHKISLSGLPIPIPTQGG